MKSFILFLTALIASNLHAQEQDTIILAPTGIENLRLKTVMVEELDFETTVFAIGRIAAFPGYEAAISSRVPGRALEVSVIHDHPIKKGEVAIIVESRQPGDPPPTIKLTSPISGFVSATHIVQGQPVSPDAVLVEIVDLSKVYAIGRVPEQLAGKLKTGQRAYISLPAVPEKSFEAKLEHIGILADPESGTVEAAFVVQNPEFTLRPGMRAEFNIVVSSRPQVMAVPKEAIQGTPADRVVYVKDFELPNAFVRAPVVTGEHNGDWVEVKSGLFPGDEVVTQGAYSLGFVGADSGMSLKEALDAAHGHEHAEDGSELSEAEQTKEDDDHDHDHGEESHSPKWLLYYAIGSSLLILVLIQQLWNKKQKTSQPS